MSGAPNHRADDAENAARSERRNLELKARLDALPPALSQARQIATQHLGCQIQQDTYFHCPTGRLKLRTIEGGPSQLVAYARPDRPDVALSRYHLVDVPHPATLHEALAATLGIWVVVCKRREIFLYHNVRIHLDQVDRLGCFLEFEAVLGPADAEPESQSRLEFLSQHFEIAPDARLETSYSDMLAALAEC